MLCGPWWTKEVEDAVREKLKELELEEEEEEEEEEGKEQGAVKPEYVTLKVVDQEDRIVKHRMRTTDEIQAVMDKYYVKAPEVDYGTGTFLFEGTVRLRGWKTPADLNLEDGAQIDFFTYADGGGWESDDAA